MDQEIRFLDFEGARLAYSSLGEGTPIVFGPRWVSHLEEEWADRRQRTFYEEVAKTHRVLRFDRVGCGLSSRELEPRPTVEAESRQLEAVIESTGEPAIVFASSCCCLAASQLAVRRPERVSKLVYFGGYASRDDIPDATKRSLIEFIRTNWTLGARCSPGSSIRTRAATRSPSTRASSGGPASAEAASIFLELDLDADVRDVLPRVPTPALVLHRRGDRTVPFGRGRELVALLPNARFVPLTGDSHLPVARRPAGAAACAGRLPARRGGSGGG